MKIKILLTLSIGADIAALQLNSVAMLLQDRLKAYNLILASGSPRRHQLLKEAGLSFCPAPRYSVDESYPDDMPAQEVAAYLSAMKAEHYPFKKGDKDIIITADTTVVVDDNVLGKPINREHATDMLRMLSDKWHTVITGVTLIISGQAHTFSSSTRVKFKALTDEEIDYYVNNFSPLDKAGSYGIQEWIGYIGIESIDGSYYNVMGLPVQRVCTELERLLSL